MANASPSIQMKKLLDEYSKEVQDALDDSIKEVSKEAVSKLKSTSPRKSGKYARGWGVKEEKNGAVVYNKTNWQLTHLLENGHIVRNKKGTYGRAPAYPHIKPVEEWASNELPLDIERRLSQ